jgi:hypothetical protein
MNANLETARNAYETARATRNAAAFKANDRRRSPDAQECRVALVSAEMDFEAAQSTYRAALVASGATVPAAMRATR